MQGDRKRRAGLIMRLVSALVLLSGTLVAPSSYFMKSPPIQIHDDIALNRVEAFIKGDDNETLVGTEAAKPKTTRKMAKARRAVETDVSTQITVEHAKAGSAAG